MSPRSSLVAAALGLLVASPLAATEDAVLAPGDRFEGKIAFVTDEDRVLFPGLAGSRVTVRAKALPGQKVHPRVVLYAGGEAVPIPPGKMKSGKNGKLHKLKRIPVAADGSIEAVITGFGAKLGAYELTIEEFLPEHVKQKLTLAPAAVGQVEFLGRGGSIATVIVSVKKKGEPFPTPVLRAPSGDSIDLTGLVQIAADGRRYELGPIVLAEDGVHRVEVTGAPGATQKTRVRVALDHAPFAGDLLVEAAGHATLNGSVTIIDGTWIPGPGSSSQSFEDDEILLRVDPEVDVEALASDIGMTVAARAPNGWVRMQRAPAGGGASVAELLGRARELPAVLEAQSNHRRGTFTPPSDTYYSEQWDLPICGFDQAWSVQGGDAQRCVAVLDTGIRAEHPDLAGRLLSGYDFVAEAWNAGDGNGIDNDPTDVFLTLGTHGTHVVGTVAASFDNALGVAGAVPNVKVLPVRVLGVLGGTDFDIAQGILYAAGLPNVSNKLPPVTADVINMSLGGPNPSPILHQAIQDAVAAGVVIVAAAGNSENSVPMYPARYAEVVAVTATDLVDAFADYSSYGSHVDLAAPGGDKKKDLDQDGNLDGILSTVVDPQLGPTYALKHGTSMAAPHVAAAAFLVRSAVPESPVELVRAALAAAAVDLGAPGFDELYGYGRLDVAEALAVAQGTAVGAPDPFLHPAPLRFDAHQTDLSLALVNRGGGGPITVTDVTSDAFWLVPQSTTGQSPGLLDVHVEKDGFVSGAYAATLTVVTSAGTLTVPVEMVVEYDGPIPVGTVYVLAIDVVTGEIARAVAVTEETADLFTLDPLPEGTYHVVAATDLDFDGVVGEGHDYAGWAIHSETVQGALPLPDGATLVGVSIELVTGAAGSLPGGGSLTLPDDV